MVMMCGTVSHEGLCRHYDDGPRWPGDSPAKERAFRQGFVEEARRIVGAWAHPIHQADIEPDPEPVSVRDLLARRRCDPFAEIEEARKLRLRVRERYTVYGTAYGPDCAGRKTYHLGYRPGHEVPAARLRGRHHAMVYVVEPWYYRDTADVDIFDPHLLYPWLAAVERWAASPIDAWTIVPPPRLLEVEGAPMLQGDDRSVQPVVERAR